MNPGPPRILTCPYCGKKKRVLTLASGNTSGENIWSDNKRDLPFLPSPSLVQRCPHCGEYFLLSRQNKKEYGDGFCTNEGKLQFHQLKDAFEKLVHTIKFTKEERQEFLFNLAWTYNDRFNSTEESGRTTSPLGGEEEKYFEYEADPIKPSEEDDDYPLAPTPYISNDIDEEKLNKRQKEWEEQIEQERRESLRKEIASDADQEFFVKIVQELMEFITDPILRAEFLREIGHFEKATIELEEANPSDEFLIKVKEKVAELIILKDTKVFSLTHLYYNEQNFSIHGL